MAGLPLLPFKAVPGDRGSREGTPLARPPRIPSLGEEGNRGRGLLRPLNSDAKVRPLLPRSFSPGQMHYEEVDFAAALQQHARERVRDHHRQRRREARDEEKRKLQEEKERQERAQQALPQIEAHRRELARQAAEKQKREREDREIHAHELDDLASARRERTRRYMMPDKVREVKQQQQHHHQSGAVEPPQSDAAEQQQIVAAERQQSGTEAPVRAARRAVRPPSDERGARGNRSRRQHAASPRGGARIGSKVRTSSAAGKAAQPVAAAVQETPVAGLDKKVAPEGKSSEILDQQEISADANVTTQDEGSDLTQLPTIEEIKEVAGTVEVPQYSKENIKVEAQEAEQVQLDAKEEAKAEPKEEGQAEAKEGMEEAKEISTEAAPPEQQEAAPTEPSAEVDAEEAPEAIAEPTIGAAMPEAADTVAAPATEGVAEVQQPLADDAALEDPKT